MSPIPVRESRYGWFVVALLMLAYVLSFVDRQILSLLVGPIRKDLGISDTQISLLMGFSFALFYTLCGIPLARWADRASRRGLIMAGVVSWSLATAACGLAQRYVHLLLARIGVGVGVGEAALSPAAYSLISDLFPRERRATAISVYSMGIYLGSGLAFLVGGAVIQFATTRGLVTLPLLGETRPWQVVFLILGAAGLVFSLALLAVREPPRTVAAGPAVTFGGLARQLKSNTSTLLYHHFGFALIALGSYGSSAWIPSYFVRVHGWSMAHTGLVYGSIVTVFGTLGIVAGGQFADRLIRRGVGDATLRVGLWGALAGIPCTALFLLAATPDLAAALLVPCVFCFSLPFGVAPAAVQEIVPPTMRAQASAVYLFVVNLIGLGLGPTLVAVVTDYVFKDDKAVGQSLLLVTMTALTAAAVLLRLGLTPYRASLARQRASEVAT